MPPDSPAELTAYHHRSIPSTAATDTTTAETSWDVSRPPDWVADAVFYQVFPDRFGSSRSVAKPPHLQPWEAPPTDFGFKGGDLIGVAEHLDWIEQLGCNALYLNPIFQSASNHRYHTNDYYRVDPLLGGDDAFDRLVSECRRRGIRIVLDGVFNHVGRGFYQFNHILEQGEESPFVDWFHIHGFPLRAYDQREGPARYEAWWGIPALPKLNTHNPDVREYLMQVGEYWVGRGADGWRLDVPQEITTEGFWEEFRQRVRARNPEAYLVGEIWDDATWWTASGERFDGTMNYLFTGYTVSFATGGRIDGEQAARLQYRVEELDAGGYAAAVQRLIDTYPPHVLQSHLNLLGSHDTARILTVAGGDTASVRLAALLTFTFPGAPCIYYGDEIGMVGGPDPSCRGAFPWDQPLTWDNDILAAFSSLAHLRQESQALRRGRYRILHAPPGQNLYVFMREHQTERLLIAVNAGDQPARTDLDHATTAGTLRRLWGAGEATADTATLRIRIPAREGAVWRVR